MYTKAEEPRSPGMVSWVQTLLNWCDMNILFIVDVSGVYANSSSEDSHETKNKSVHTQFSELEYKIFMIKI